MPDVDQCRHISFQAKAVPGVAAPTLLAGKARRLNLCSGSPHLVGKTSGLLPKLLLLQYASPRGISETLPRTFEVT